MSDPLLNVFARIARTVVLIGVSCASPLFAQTPGPRTAPLSEEERVVHLLNRATFGARPEDVERVMQTGREAWVEQQLHPEVVEAELPEPGPGSSLLLGIMRRPDDPQEPRQIRYQLRRRLDHGDDVATANKLVRAARSERQLEQVMADFWFNHFSVYQAKGDVGKVLSDYDDTIRSHAFGRFRDMLGAVAHHPAMLVYLDNYLNGVPPSGAAGSANAGSINENYARELLELHTLGVDGGYTQQDMTQVARAFTGWTMPYTRQPNPGELGPAVEPLSFFFRREWHDAGEKVVLGRTLSAGRGIEDGEDVLDILARHPSTARHLATKLVRHFVADDPPAELVDEIARVFLATDGDLAAVTRALFTDERFYDPAHYRAKVKRPFDFVVSSLRATGASLGSTSTAVLQNRLALLQQAPYQAPAPTGYPVTADDWVSTGAMLERMNLAVEMSNDAVEYVLASLSAGTVDPLPEPAVSVDPWTMLGLEPNAFEALGGNAFARSSVTRVLGRALPGAATTQLEAELATRLTAPTSAEEADVFLRRAIALVLGSPEFQRY